LYYPTELTRCCFQVMTFPPTCGAWGVKLRHACLLPVSTFCISTSAFHLFFSLDQNFARGLGGRRRESTFSWIYSA
jgi:hypothetical protein